MVPNLCLESGAFVRPADPYAPSGQRTEFLACLSGVSSCVVFKVAVKALIV
jgi:hypothetical protein